MGEHQNKRFLLNPNKLAVVPAQLNQPINQLHKTD
jgi:hypothetical protein